VSQAAGKNFSTLSVNKRCRIVGFMLLQLEVPQKAQRHDTARFTERFTPRFTPRLMDLNHRGIIDFVSFEEADNQKSHY
jgi:hypothetical protein